MHRYSDTSRAEKIVLDYVDALSALWDVDLGGFGSNDDVKRATAEMERQIDALPEEYGKSIGLFMRARFPEERLALRDKRRAEGRFHYTDEEIKRFHAWTFAQQEIGDALLVRAYQRNKQRGWEEE